METPNNESPRLGKEKKKEMASFVAKMIIRKVSALNTWNKGRCILFTCGWMLFNGGFH